MNADLYNNLNSAVSVNFVGRTSTVNGSGVDLQGYDGALLVVQVGAWAGNQGTWAIKLQDSPDNSTFTDVAAGQLVGSNITLSGQINRVAGEQGYVGPATAGARYLRAVGTLTGGGSSCVWGATIVRGARAHGGTRI